MSTESKTIEELLAKLAPNRNIVGIDNELGVYEGYDANIYDAYLRNPYDEYFDNSSFSEWEQQSLTSNEKLLLANEMIRRWTEYRNRIKHPAES
jgi:hypothetical protein